MALFIRPIKIVILKGCHSANKLNSSIPNLQSRISGPSITRSMPGVNDLFIVAGNDYFSCAVANPASRRFIGFEHWEFTDPEYKGALENLFSESQLANALTSYRRVNCCLTGSPNLFVPDALYERESAANQLKLAYGELPVSNTFLTDDISELQVKNLHIPNTAIQKSVSAVFKQCEFHHSATVRLKYLMSFSAPGKEPVILAHIHREQLEVTIIKGKSFLFHNSFQCHSPEEMLYYLLLVFEQLHINPETADLFFAGNIDPDSDHFKIARKYVMNCRLSGLPSLFTYDQEFSSLHANWHFDLFSLPVCVS